MKLEHDELKPLDFERPELEKYEPEKYEEPEKPAPEPVPKPYEPEEKKKPDQEIEQIPLIKGKPKPQEADKELEVKFRIPQKNKTRRGTREDNVKRAGKKTNLRTKVWKSSQRRKKRKLLKYPKKNLKKPL